MPSPYGFARTVRWPVDFLMPNWDVSDAPRSHRHEALTKFDAGEAFKLVFLGDLMVSQFDRPPAVCQEFQDILVDADLVFACCEAPLIVGRAKKKHRYFSNFLMPTDYLAALLRNLQVEPERVVLSFANNHIADAGVSIAQQSHRVARDMGLNVVGFRDSDGVAAAEITLGGHKICVYAWTEWMNRKSAAIRDIVNWTGSGTRPVVCPINKSASFTIALPHWGYEFRHAPNSYQRKLAAEIFFLDKMDLIVGSHSHSLQGMELFPGGGLCAYSLGNVVFTQALFTGLANAWSLSIVPILTVNLQPAAHGRLRIAGYSLDCFYQTGRWPCTEIVSCVSLQPALHDRIRRLVSIIFDA